MENPPISPIKITDTDYFGIPDKFFEKPADIDAVIADLQILEDKGEKPDRRKTGFFSFFKADPPSDYTKMETHSGHRRFDIYTRLQNDIVIKYDNSVSNFGNTGEYNNSKVYATVFKGVWVHFPVWGVTARKHFLVMAKAEDVPFGREEFPPDIVKKAVVISGKFTGDCGGPNVGYICDKETGIRYWASVDIDFGLTVINQV